MTTLVDSEHLCSVLELVTSVTKRAVRNSMEFFRIKAQEGRLIFTATDGEIFLHKSIVADCKDDWDVAVLGKDFATIYKYLTDDDVQIECLKKRLSFRQGKSSYEVSIGDPEEFLFSHVPDESTLDPVSPESFLSMIDRTEGAVSKSDHAGPAIKGILFEDAGDAHIRAVATNGSCLITCKEMGFIPESFLLTRSAAVFLKKILKGEESLSIGVKDNMVNFRTENAFVSIRCLAHKYPNYKKIFPKGEHTSLSFDRDEFKLAIQRLCAFSESPELATVGMRTTEDTAFLTLKFKMREGEEQIAIKRKGEVTFDEVLFNPHFFLHSLGKTKEDDITLRIYGGLRPMVLMGDDNSITLIMPKKG